ncbi:SDR family NAD(P)-dependent oxidoreductase [Rhodococcus sp. JVH1]|uniref:SDR family NAD(P)-dependent oxidoreductase n=1 Tax=Rhodococcus sp. JVH1 TaxID=745408 RepID=UPI001ED8DCA7|nr:SDR family NAD(P)-dependent oxidoreductase [Rhodococcus sp. JVH1]
MGASSGIGIETARALATAGADVTIAVRNPDAGRGVADDINTALGQERVAVRTLDLADLSSVHRFAEQWGSTALDVLINNAGIMATPLGRTRSGWESLAVRDQPPRSLRAGERPSRRARTCRRCANRVPEFPRTLELRHRLRRHQLRQPRMCCSQSRRPAAGHTTESRQTRCIPAGSGPT